jgi:hypothetical protein
MTIALLTVALGASQPPVLSAGPQPATVAQAAGTPASRLTVGVDGTRLPM